MNLNLHHLQQIHSPLTRVRFEDSCAKEELAFIKSLRVKDKAQRCPWVTVKIRLYFRLSPGPHVGNLNLLTF